LRANQNCAMTKQLEQKELLALVAEKKVALRKHRFTGIKNSKEAAIARGHKKAVARALTKMSEDLNK
jgi:ribosomal protein L29